jgi:hypothetical protein
MMNQREKFLRAGCRIFNCIRRGGKKMGITVDCEPITGPVI